MANAIPLRGGRQRGDAYRHRGSARQRGYTTSYDKARQLALARHPLCRVCESRGVVRQAAETHHVVPVASDRSMADDAGNLLCVCLECHDEVEGLSWTVLGERYGVERWPGAPQ
jgi:5-methylcytosine-specific restriction protein A